MCSLIGITYLVLISPLSTASALAPSKRPRQCPCQNYKPCDCKCKQQSFPTL